MFSFLLVFDECHLADESVDDDGEIVEEVVSGIPDSGAR